MIQDEQALKFFEFIYDRHLIYYKRFVIKEPAPWTKNEVMQKTHFCNVYRELDKGTIYLIEKALHAGHSPEMTLFNTIMYRIFNVHGFFENVVPPMHPSHFDFKMMEKLFDYKKKEMKLFNTAYVVTQMAYDKEYRKSDKHIQFLMVLRDLAPQMVPMVTKLMEAKTGEEAFKVIQTISLVGPFLAYEIYCDLAYCDWFPFSCDDFVNIGPGAKWGLELMAGVEKLPIKQCAPICYKLYSHQHRYFCEVQRSTGKNFHEIAYKGQPKKEGSVSLSLRNIEHSLCEYRKFLNISNGKGKRRNFTPFSK